MTGIAALKPEYLYKQEHGWLAAQPSIGNAAACVNAGNGKPDEPPPKRVRMRGQNKDRPRDIRPDAGTRVCPSLIQGLDCAIENCAFLHNLQTFWSSKPDDIGETCYNLTVKGKCPYGIACRFARAHTDPETLLQLRQSDALAASAVSENCGEVGAVLDRELQRSLRKNEYDNGFSRFKEFQALSKKPLSSDVSKSSGALTDEDIVPLCVSERKNVDFAGKLYLAPLTTIGNLPYRRICVEFGADITCGEMALSTNLLQGLQQEWALVKRHPCEKVFGVQLCGNFVDSMSKCAQVVVENASVDFIDINLGCPIDLVCQRGSGCAMMARSRLIGEVLNGMHHCMGNNRVPITIKMRTGIKDNKRLAHSLISELKPSGKVALFTLHGRSKDQRYTKLSDWTYIDECAKLAADSVPLFGCGDILSFEDYYNRLDNTAVAGCMLARGAIIKPWLFTEIKERRHWDISSSERFDILRSFVNYGLEHWGSDQIGVDKTRRFLLEWLSFLYRYIPVGLLERPPQRINERPPAFFGRNDLETLMASPNCNDWIKISEMLLGKVSENFAFLPKHKANSYGSETVNSTSN